MANFPVLDKKPDVNMVQNYNDSTINSGMETGLEITRPRFPRVRREWQVSYRSVLQNDLDALDDFIRNQVLGGSGSFSWTHPGTGEVVTVRFSQLPTPTETGWVTNNKLIAQGASLAAAQGIGQDFNFKVREV